MITTRIKGGLGNQLFQYAAGLALAKHRDETLQLDIGSFVAFPLRRYHLDELGVEAPTFIGIESDKQVNEESVSKLGSTLYREKSDHFDAGLFSAAAPTYLDGYWQSCGYLESVGSALRESLDLGIDPNRFGDPRDHSGAIAVHIRRGDYASKEAIRNRFGLQPIDYYTTAARQLADQVEQPHFYVFSDDIDWVRTNLPLPGEATFVSGTDGVDSTVSDFAMMSRCRHFITANSTFSWWAAFLGRTDSAQQVIVPERWYADGSVTRPDFIPEGWVQL